MPSISRTPSIYQIRHIESGKVYVGSAANPRKRWGIHRTELNQGKHHSQHLQSAWNKYGKDAFVFEIIEPVLFIEDLLVREQHWIDTLHASDREYGFNSAPTAGSVLGVKRSAEFRSNLSDRQRARYADPAQRARTSEQQKAYYADPAQRAKLAELHKAHFADPAQRAKASERAKAQFADPAERAKLSERTKAQYADPAERAKASERTKAQYADPDARAKASERTKAQWADPEFRARRKMIRDARKQEGKE